VIAAGATPVAQAAHCVRLAAAPGLARACGQLDRFERVDENERGAAGRPSREIQRRSREAAL
jgi:hypothetical protein